MKFSSFKFLTYVSIPLLALMILGIGMFVMRHEAPFVRAELLDNLAGHAWDYYFGWSSYNSCNPAYTNPPYLFTLDNCWVPDWGGLNADFNPDGSGEISGFMWHDALGWICVGSTCEDTVNFPTVLIDCGSTAGIPGGGSLPVTFAPPDPDGWATTTGWGRICAWGDSPAAWVSFNCANTQACPPDYYGVYINVDDFSLGNPNTVTPPLTSDYGECPLGYADCGFAWNGFEADGLKYGAGHIMFSPEDSVIHQVHFETKEGDVYSFTKIKPKLEIGDGAWNATYLVLSNEGTITNFTSEQQYRTIAESYVASSTYTFNFKKIPPQLGATRIYYNALSKIDIAGMLAGDYGGTIKTYGAGASEDLLAVLGVLDNTIYNIQDDFTITSPLEFEVGSGQKSGAGTIIVEGDLTINEDITYQNGTLTDLFYLPSVTWIVLGDVIIGENVSEVVGNFFVLGDGDPTVCPALSQAANGCGRFSTGVTSDLALTVSGSVMAKQFNFQRLYTDALNNPAELFVFDGRILANTPPGLQNLVENIPIFSEGTPF